MEIIITHTLEADYASKIILKEIAARKLIKGKKWYDKLFTDRRIAKDIEDRARKGTLGFKSASPVLIHFGYELFKNPMESMWRPVRIRTWEVYHNAELIDTVKAKTADEALTNVAIGKFGETDSYTDYSGNTELKWLGYKCRLVAKEID